MNRLFGIVLGCVLSGLVGCGAPAGPAGGSGPGTSPPGTNPVSGTCCLNNQFYSCATKEAFDKCAGFDPGACHAACGTDVDCHIGCDMKAENSQHDPSACTRNASQDSSCTTTTAGSCKEQRGLRPCTYSTQCSSGNCTKGYCYGNAVGELCTYSTQCSSTNCTNGCCSGNSVGSACTYSTQCDSSNCTDGHCR